jgi:histidyl-tRNA synthetase
MFRYERPQKGRLRQFHQIGVEVFGLDGPDIDAELLAMTWRLWQQLGIDQQVALQINSLGTTASRARYRDALVEYLTRHKDSLDEDSQRRLHSNPMRILDSKNPAVQAVLDGAPVLDDFLDGESLSHFRQLQALLKQAGVPYQINNRLVRGLDYYGKTVFEWVTNALGAQGAVCAGGRYDGLVEQLGGKHTPAVGFAMGLERLVLLLDAAGVVPDSIARQLDVYLVAVGDVQGKAIQLGEELRSQCPQLRLLNHCGGGGFKAQMKRADKSSALVALILGEDEVVNDCVTVKFLREDRPQESIAIDSAVAFLKRIFLVNGS